MAEARAMAQAQLGMMMAATRQANRRQTRRGERFIKGLGQAFASELRGISSGVGDVYDSAKNEQAAMNSALGSFLSGQGETQAANLGEQLGSIDPNTAAFYSNQARAAGSALSKQGYAYGSQNLQRTIGEGAGDEAYARSLPGIAALSSIQSARSFEGRMGSKLMDELGQIRAQGPAMTNQLFGSLADYAMGQANMHMQGQELGLRRDELALRRKELGLNEDAQGSDRLQQTLAMARELVSTGINDPITGLPKQGAAAAPPRDLMAQVEALMESELPGMPASKRAYYADLVMRTFMPFYDMQMMPDRPSLAGQGGGVSASSGAGRSGPSTRDLLFPNPFGQAERSRWGATLTNPFVSPFFAIGKKFGWWGGG